MASLFIRFVDLFSSSFSEFVDLVLKTDDKLLHHSEGESPPVSRRRFRNRMNAMEEFNDRRFLACYCFRKATVASLLKSLLLEVAFLIALQFYGAGTFRCTVTGEKGNVSQLTMCRQSSEDANLIPLGFCAELGTLHAALFMQAGVVTKEPLLPLTGEHELQPNADAAFG
ncbi:hypothetical protein HPB47_000959 [Ixodes persulcatus]|uniref:Uncharacterized protein n=1 Tax=Ixodes persulcatus TaxID=34615 RepID=A0AC60PQE3_IXOPE|nr:hypothetical protein HPB47_000959 [Ixodes persulcatus]